MLPPRVMVMLKRKENTMAHRSREVGDWRTYFTTAQDERFKAVWEEKMGGTTLARYVNV